MTIADDRDEMGPGEPVDDEIGRSTFGALTLMAGILALGLAVVTTIVFEVRPPWLGSAPEPKVVKEKAIEWRGLRFRWGEKPDPAEAAAAAKKATEAKSLSLATAAFALSGLVLGPIAYRRERRWGLVGPGMAFSFLALIWQYVLVGLMVGVGAAIFLIILAHA